MLGIAMYMLGKLALVVLGWWIPLFLLAWFLRQKIKFLPAGSPHERAYSIAAAATRLAIAAVPVIAVAQVMICSTSQCRILGFSLV